MTAPVYWNRYGPHLEALVTETDVPVQGDAIMRNVHKTASPAGQLWERLAERAS